MSNKILFTASTYSHIHHFHRPYLKHFQEQGYEVHVACSGKPQDEPMEINKMIALPFEKSMWSLSNFEAARLLRRRIQQENYALIVTHTSLAAFFTRLAVLGLKNRPVLINMAHGYLFDDDTPALKRRILLTAEQLTAPVTDLLLTMNEWDYATALHYHLGKRVENIPGIGVDFSRIKQYTPATRRKLREKMGIPDDSFVLLYAAEFSQRKSQEVLIRAMKKLPDNVLLILAGNGAQLDECRALAEELGLSDRISFPGYLENIGAWYPLADAAVSASRSEGLPFNIMESMYAGLPVVASMAKGHTDLIADGETGLLYPYGDSDACALQIMRLLNSPALGQKLAVQARTYVAQYSLDQVLPSVSSWYESALPQSQEKDEVSTPV